MKRLILITLVAGICSQMSAQSTLLKVYDILQAKCVSCHGASSPAAGLNLIGNGSTNAVRALSVRSTLLTQNVQNAAASNKSWPLVSPGRVDKSFLFHKINQGLEPTLAWDASYGNQMPNNPMISLSNVEKEVIRQWILFGAPTTGSVVDVALIESYYAGNGIASFPDGPPPAPAANEGFQVKMGPFFLAPDGQNLDEIEYYQKYALDLPANVEVNRIQFYQSGYSHHFILYKFLPGGGNSIPQGLRTNSFHNDIRLVAAVQEPIDLHLPEGSAFKWAKNDVLDLNSHYINYSATQVHLGEVYFNVYTQPTGTAAQEMQTELIANTSIVVPNNGNPVTATQIINSNLGEVFMWGIMGHTHKYGTGYQVFKREQGVQGEMIYDAGCPQGIPGCNGPVFDYRHIPILYYEPFLPIQMNFANGLIHKANWLNDGPSTLYFGPTSNDEMMVLVLMYLNDTTGVSFPTATRDVAFPQRVNAYPNPAIDQLHLPSGASPVTQMEWMRADGSTYPLSYEQTSEELIVEVSHLPQGCYFVQWRTADGKRWMSKFVK